MGNSIEEEIEILEELRTHGYAMLLMKYENRIKTNRKIDQALEHIVSDYKRVLKDNERYKKSDYETICLENNELREITDRIQSEYNDLLKDNFKLKNELETKRKEYQETYKDVREELKELRKENEGLNNRCRNLDKEAQAYLEELAGDNTLTRRTIKQLQEENEELKNDYENLSNSVVVKNYYIENSIPVQKVKDNIKKLEIKKEKVRGERNILERFAIEKSINSLQELLESED